MNLFYYMTSIIQRKYTHSGNRTNLISRIWMKLNVKREFCFLCSHIYNLKNILNIPEKIVTWQRTVSSGVDALCILLTLKAISFSVNIPTRFLHLGEIKQNYTLLIMTYLTIYTLDTIIICNHGPNTFYYKQS